MAEPKRRTPPGRATAANARSASTQPACEDLVKALDNLKVGEKEKNELLGVVGPMKGDIVEKP